MLDSMEWCARGLSLAMDALGDPRQKPELWEQFWCTWPHQWDSLLRRVLKRDAEALGRTVELRGQEEVLPVPQGGQWVCSLCGEVFATARGRAAHQQVRHGRQHRMRNAAPTSTCPVCDVDFRTMARLQDHLVRGRLACRLAAAAGWGFGGLTEEVVGELSVRQRMEVRAARAEGRHATTGPPAILPAA